MISIYPQMHPDAYAYLWPTINDMEEEIISQDVEILVKYNKKRKAFYVENDDTSEVLGSGPTLVHAFEAACHHLVDKKKNRELEDDFYDYREDILE
jgi:hypothetical protein